MSINFSTYEKLRSQGVDATAAYKYGKESGLDLFELIRMLRKVYGLSLTDAKELTVTIDNSAASLSEYQEKLLPFIRKILE